MGSALIEAAWIAPLASLPSGALVVERYPPPPTKVLIMTKPMIKSHVAATGTKQASKLVLSRPALSEKLSASKRAGPRLGVAEPQAFSPQPKRPESNRRKCCYY